MKSRKVLIGVIVATLVGGMHFANAQPKANYQNNLIEIGPDNIAGRVRSIVVDEADPNHNTLFAGGVAGGLYRKIGDDIWQYLPYITADGGKEITLPISCMVQLPNNDLLIGTGEGIVTNHGVNDDVMAPKGRGLFLYRHKEQTFTPISVTNPMVNADWSYINRIAVMERASHLYIYVATDAGLYAWNFENADDINWQGKRPDTIATGRFLDVIMLRADNIAYATAPGKVLRIGDVMNGSAPVDVTSSNKAFKNASRIELAGATIHNKLDDGTISDETVVYALVSDTAGLLDGVYITKDQQNWTRLTTATVVPFTSTNPGTHNASIAIDPRNYKHIYVGGASLWSGEGFVENSFYTWTKSSYSENELNGGNYMNDVYTSPMFIHSGIHQIVSTFKAVEHDDGTKDTTWLSYFATDGGVFVTGDASNPFRSLNKGLNTVQFNGLAVSPDGSLIGGAVDNACPFIQSRNAHNGSVPFNHDQWYDTDSNSIFNHVSNVIWLGNGGGVAASKFQQLSPYTRRTLFVSAEPGYFTYSSGMGTMGVASYGRANSDYADYTNTQTWTMAEAFLSDIIPGSNPVPTIKLWETTNNTIWKDTISFTIDTSRTYIHNGEETQMNDNTVFQPGDRILVPSKPNNDYPFYHTFTSSHNLSDLVTEYDTITRNGSTIIDTNTYRRYNLNLEVPNKVVSRAILNARNIRGVGCVFMTMTPNWFRNVWDVNEAGSTDASVLAKLMTWVKIYEADAGHSVGDIAFSRDGKSVFITVTENKTGKSFIFRLYDYVQINVNRVMDMRNQLTFTKDDPSYTDNPRRTHFDTIFASDNNMFSRPISSLYVDPRDGQDNLIVTFAGYNNGDPNIVLVSNATNPAQRRVSDISVVYAANNLGYQDPVYSALIECKSGNFLVGTEKGVFKADGINNLNWKEVGAFNGVPVTSIIQQTDSMPRMTYNAREGVNDVKYLFAKTKYPYAIYYGTYGRGIFMDTAYVNDMTAETSNPEDWLGITTADNGDNHLKIYPNPAKDQTTVEVEVVNAGNAIVKIYDISGKLVHSESLGYLTGGIHHYNLDCQKFSRGMYLVNINFGDKSATSKLIVR